MGLVTLPTTPVTAPTVQFDQKRNAWMIETLSPNSGQRMRSYFDRNTLLPAHIESLNDRGEVILSSDLRRYESVKKKGMSPAAFPKMAQLIDIAEVNPALKNPGKVMIAINDYTDGLIDEQPFDRVFDIKRLALLLHPDRIEGQPPPE
jgi:hypothetical protein